jgi:hypothetical protein
MSVIYWFRFLNIFVTYMRLEKIRISLISRAIAFLMAVYLFNFSIDSRDAHADSVAEDLSFNDIESVYEFLAEGLLGIENAVEEHDERDQEDGGSFEFKKVYFIVSIPQVQAKAPNYISSIYSSIDFCDPLAIRAAEIISPPPRA